MNVELKRIAEKKLEQIGGTVCGVLVRKDDRLAAVDEHGRVQWLQGGQGAEPVFWWDGDLSDLDDCVSKEQSAYHTIPLYTHPHNGEQGGEWIKCSERLPEPRYSGRKAPNGILAKFSSGRISHFREVTETLVTNMKNGPRQVLKFETPKPPRIVEWLDLDSPQPPKEDE